MPVKTLTRWKNTDPLKFLICCGLLPALAFGFVWPLRKMSTSMLRLGTHGFLGIPWLGLSTRTALHMCCSRGAEGSARKFGRFDVLCPRKERGQGEYQLLSHAACKHHQASKSHEVRLYMQLNSFSTSVQQGFSCTSFGWASIDHSGHLRSIKHWRCVRLQLVRMRFRLHVKWHPKDMKYPCFAQLKFSVCVNRIYKHTHIYTKTFFHIYIYYIHMDGSNLFQGPAATAAEAKQAWLVAEALESQGPNTHGRGIPFTLRMPAHEPSVLAWLPFI